MTPELMLRDVNQVVDGDMSIHGRCNESWNSREPVLIRVHGGGRRI